MHLSSSRTTQWYDSYPSPPTPTRRRRHEEIGLETYTNLQEAVNGVLAAIKPMGRSERVPTTSALGRVAVDEIIAGSDSPRLALSHMDGFAVIASDLRGTQRSEVKLRIIGESGPESSRPLGVGHGEAVRVSTGARIPDGADAVIPAEETREEAGRIAPTAAVKPGAFVYPAGADFRKGELLLRKNQKIRAQDVGLLLTLGVETVDVLEVPTVAVVATGSELFDLGSPSPGKVLNTHGPLIANMVRAAGCVPLDMGVSPDEKGELSLRIRGALDKSDLVMTLGGTSVGRRDLVADVVRGLRPEVLYHGLRMDRGRVAGVAVLRRKPLLMLPGPVQGAMNAFVLLGIPMLDKIRGGGSSVIRVRAKLVGSWNARPRFRDFTKAVYVRLVEGDGLEAEPLSGETESISILTKATGFVVVPEHVTRMNRGDFVEVNLVPGLSYVW